MLGVLIAFFGGGFVGLCIGVYLVADNVRRSPSGCLACQRPWAHTHDHGAHVHTIVRTPEPYDQDNQGEQA